ncbi:IPT/TIG domain-containing protein [Ferruginibacter albus]|uniref:IPT/TIG domain-containing protein n=1 Tax=Ferruginibacter albus TaxID=2875540 RepID=UPI001CC35B24|nr:IPT/TIG domain-containing protein [Ferruginibacter albus]UAY52886.1 IPT/TIG domain-containing protein [Ferruginibacter albus]
MKKLLLSVAFIFAFSNLHAQNCTVYTTVDTTVECYNLSSFGERYWGTYTLNLISSKGCDSIVTLNLNAPVYPSDTTYETLSECALPISWGLNIDIFQPGIYENVIEHGCNPELREDEIHYLKLTVISADTVRSSQTICYDQLPYEWNGQIIYEPGSYYNVSSSVTPCSVQEVDITILPQKESYTDTVICANKLPFHWNGQDYTASGNYYATIPGQPCDSVATLNLTVVSNSTSTTNVAICGDKVPYIWNGKNYSASGTYTATFPLGKGKCDSIAQLNLTVNPLPVISSFTPTTATQGQAVVINGSNLANVTAVNIGGVPAASFNIISSNAIVASVGAASAGAVTVTNACGNGTLAGFSFNPMMGGLGIGTVTPTSKLTVTGGDIQVTDAGSGIILKSPDGKCWKLFMGLSGGFNHLQVVEIPCP